MGQYYMVLMEDKNGKRTVYDRTTNGEYTLAKLMEHSWWLNNFVNTMCCKIFRKPKKVAWVGDYSDGEFELYDEVWGDNAKRNKVWESQVVLWNKYLVNHTKKEYLNCNEYYEKSKIEDDWCIHPLPLLTCVGNGGGGGDYHRGTCMDYVGSWCMDEISVEVKEPKGYTKIDIAFKEN